jgi:ligand-binding SRPBCC domain-containing protein
MRDRVAYALPLGPVGRLGSWFVRHDLEKVFDFRAEAMRRLFPDQSRDQTRDEP